MNVWATFLSIKHTFAYHINLEDVTLIYHSKEVLMHPPPPASSNTMGKGKGIHLQNGHFCFDVISTHIVAS